MKKLMMIFLAVLVASCASPQYRIEKNPSVFAEATSQQKDKIQKGEIDLGFKPGFVELALGKPDKVVEKTLSQNNKPEYLTIWIYTDFKNRPGSSFLISYPIGRYGYYQPILFNDTTVEEEKFRVVFEKGLVVGFEKTHN